MAGADGADRTVRRPQGNGQRPTRACRARRQTTRSARHSRCRESASAARQNEVWVDHAAPVSGAAGVSMRRRTAEG